MLPLIIAGVAVAIGVYALYMWATGNDPAYEVATAIGDAIRTVSNSLADAITTTVNVLLAPIRIPATYFASGLSRLTSRGGPLAVLFFVVLYFYMVIALVSVRKPDPQYTKFLIYGFVLSVVGYRIRLVLSSRFG